MLHILKQQIISLIKLTSFGKSHKILMKITASSNLALILQAVILVEIKLK